MALGQDRRFATTSYRQGRGCACLVAFYAGGNLRLTRRYGRLRQRLKSRRGNLGVRFSQDNANSTSSCSKGESRCPVTDIELNFDRVTLNV